eukprot:gene6761-8982_t
MTPSPSATELSRKPVDTAESPTRGPAGLRQVRLSRSLGWLFVAMFLPLMVMGITFSAFQWNRQRDLAYAQLLDQARGLRLAVERELALDEAVANAL